MTLHSLLDRDVYRGGAIVVGPVRRGRGRRVRVERRVVPVSADPERRLQVLERELWRIAVENLNFSEQHAWAALAGARVTPNHWRRAKAMIQHDQAQGAAPPLPADLRPAQPQPPAPAEGAGRDRRAARRRGVRRRVDIVATWSRDERRAGVKVLLQALAERRIGRRDQAQAWVWRLAAFTRELHEEYAVQRWPETKRLLGLFVNSSGRAHGRNARRLVTAARQQDRRLAVALLAAAVAHTPEAEEVLRGARMRMARKPSAVARELLRNFPKPGSKRRRRRKRGKGGERRQGGERRARSRSGENAARRRRADRRSHEDARGTRADRRSRRRRGVTRARRAQADLAASRGPTRSPVGGLDEQVAALVDPGSPHPAPRRRRRRPPPSRPRGRAGRRARRTPRATSLRLRPPPTARAPRRAPRAPRPPSPRAPARSPASAGRRGTRPRRSRG